MRLLWTLVKVVVGLAIIVPLGIIAAGLALGILGTLIGLAILALKLACIALVGYGLFRAAKFFFGSNDPAPVKPVASLPQRDLYYEAAMRELDREIGPNR